MRKYVLSFVAVGLLLFVAMIMALSPGANVAAAPQLAPQYAPTPVSINAGAGNAKTLTFWSSRVITEDAASACLGAAAQEKIDLQWVIDQTAGNPVTLTLQHSNDGGVNVVNGAAAVVDNQADANDMQQFAIFGGCTRVHADATTANPVTVTVIGVAK